MTEQAKVPAIRFAGFTDPWEQRKFSDIVDVCSGKDYKHLEEGPIPVYGTGGFMTSVDEALSYDRDAVGIGRKGTIDKPYLLKAPFWTVDTLFYAIPKSDMDLEFVHCSFLNVDWKSKDESTGLPSLSKEAINETIALVPSFNEQSRLGEFFSDLDSLITLHQRKYDKLVVFKKSMLEKMFPKDGESVPEIRFAGFTDPWEQRKASEVFQIVDDRGHPTLPVLSATQNQGMIYRDDSGRYIGHDESNEIGYKRVLPGDFVVHLRSFQGGFAHSQYEGITSPAYTVFRAKEPTSHSDRFWKHWFMSEHFIAGLSTVTYGIRDGRSISVDEFMNTFLAFPAVEEQAAISRLLDYLDDLITLHQRKRQWLKWLDEGGEGTHHDIDILVFKFADDMKISVLCGVHACMTKSLGHTGNRYAGKQQQRGMGVP